MRLWLPLVFRARRRGFTLIEMLVVVTVIAILAGLLLPGLFMVRRHARITKCKSNLHQIGLALSIYAQQYGEGRTDGYPPWLTLLTTTGGARHFIEDPRVLFCPDDSNNGTQGGRPDHVRYENNNNPIDQFEIADVDEHTGPLNGVGPKNAGDGGIDCSYIFEFNGEPCDWVYNSGPPIAAGTSVTVPGEGGDPYEWRWGSKPDEATFKAKVDVNGDGILSWNEVKSLSQKGWPEQGLNPWHNSVPLIRCYWHVEGGQILRDNSLVLDLLGDYRVNEGVPPWFK